MTINEQLPPDLNLSEAELRQLDMIERAGTRSFRGRLFAIASPAILPVALWVFYVYVLQQIPTSSGLALCRLRGSFYIPEPEALDKVLRAPLTFFSLAAFLWPVVFYLLESQQRLCYKVMLNIVRRYDHRA